MGKEYSYKYEDIEHEDIFSLLRDDSLGKNNSSENKMWHYFQVNFDALFFSRNDETCSQTSEK